MRPRLYLYDPDAAAALFRDHELLAHELEGAPGVARDPTAVYSALGRIEVAMARFLLPPEGRPAPTRRGHFGGGAKPN